MAVLSEISPFGYERTRFSMCAIRPKFVLLVLLIAASCLDAQQSQFRSAFHEFVHADGTVGASFAALDQGRITDSGFWGLADSDLKQPVSSATVFHWGSITKTLTAVAIMQLRDRGKLSLDDPIVKYVPELMRIHGQDNAVSRVTLRQLMSHTAGFQTPTWTYREGKPWEPFEPSEWAQLVAMMPYQELAFTPGSKYQYSNPAFIYLARVIEILTGDAYQVYVQKNILTPLGMTHTFYNVSPYHLAKDRSNSYEIVPDVQGHQTVRAFGREFDTGITTANGGLNAPVEDMAKWISFLAGTSPASRSDLILNRKSLEEMWHPVIAIDGQTYAPPATMGLSFFLFPRGSGNGAVTLVGHTGHQAGFAAFFVMNPRTGRAVIAVVNTVHTDEDRPVAKKEYEESQKRFSALMEQAMRTVQ